MPYNGSGVYTAPSLPGSFNPAVASQAATPTDFNTLLTDLCTALSSVITKDGQTTITQNIPFNSKKITGLGNATASTDAVNAGQVIGGTLTGVNDTGAADAYVIAPTIAIAAYAAYQNFQFKAANTNTGASTLAVSGLAAKAIKHLDGTALLAGDIVSGEIVDVTYDGTNFQLLSATGMRGTANTWTAAQAWTGTAQFGGTTTLVAAALNGAIRNNVASATTADIGAAPGNYVRITGTTTITGLGTVGSGASRDVLFAGILTLTHNATSLILPTGANITTAAGDTATFTSEGGGNWRCTNYQRATGRALAAYSVIQIASTTDGTYATTAGTGIPTDNTIPQNTEGDQIMSLAITPISATSKLIIDVSAVIARGNSDMVAMALFQDSTAGALAVVADPAVGSTPTTITMRWIMTSGTTSATTFKVRVGSDTPAVLYFNGISSGALYGGTMASGITITEYLA